jgi:hypothetical protein
MATMPPSPFTALPASSAETLVVAPSPQAPVAAISGPFDSGVEPSSPDEAAALTRSHAPGAAVDIPDLPSNEGRHQGAPAVDDWNPETAGATDCCIGEIFVGARKLFDPDPAAYLREDELLHDVLKAMDNPHEHDLPCIPDEQAFMDAIDPPPLFLRQARA